MFSTISKYCIGIDMLQSGLWLSCQSMQLIS